MSGARVLIMAGGTGGHIFPALAVARALTARGVEVNWLGSRAGLEARLVPEAGIPIDYIGVSGLRGKGLAGWLAAPLHIARAVAQAASLLKRLRPGAVLGMGGFASGPGGLAARLLRVPLVIHEQNAVAGLTNRVLARIASRVFEAFPGALAGAEVVGNPVRLEIAALADPRDRLGARDGRLRLLVVGGSLGAAFLNEVVPKALAHVPAERRPVVVHQSGERQIDAARRHYHAAGVEADVRPFLDDMAACYAWADLVICRAGALTVSELAAAGLGAVLVPFPHAVDDHQTQNARYLTGAGAAVLAPQSGLDASGLAGLLTEFTADAACGRHRLLQMAESARGVARTDAAERVADACLTLAVGGRH